MSLQGYTEQMQQDSPTLLSSESMPNATSAAFELLFGRQPRPDEQDVIAPELSARIKRSPELFAALLQLRRNQQSPEHASLRALMQSPTARLLQQSHHLDDAAYENAYQAKLADAAALIIGQREYLPQHKRRFHELFNACSYLLAHRPSPRLLEFGASEFSSFYKQLIPGLRLHLSDRPTPTDYIGFTERVGFERLGCDAYFAIDLEHPAQLGVAQQPGPRPRDYDLIVFAEVLEHLVVNPVDLLSGLLRLLKPEGFLYLTTPNLFRAENRERWLALENPQQIYPAADGNWDRHHHHREYGAAELLRFAQQAGGEVVAFYYSDCWDQPSECALDERSNLVFLIAPAVSPEDAETSTMITASQTA